MMKNHKNEPLEKASVNLLLVVLLLLMTFVVTGFSMVAFWFSPLAN